MELFQRSRGTARRVVAPLVEHAPLYMAGRRVACRPICDFRGSLVFASVATWEAGATGGECDGMHLGSDDPFQADVAETLLTVLLDALDGGLFMVWDVTDVSTFLSRYATLPQVRRVLEHLENAVELLPIFKRLGRGGYSPSLVSAASTLADVPTRSQLFTAEEISRDVIAQYAQLSSAGRDEPQHVTHIAFCDPEVWAEEWSAAGTELSQALLEEDARLFVRRLQEVDAWLLHEVMR